MLENEKDSKSFVQFMPVVAFHTEIELFTF